MSLVTETRLLWGGVKSFVPFLCDFRGTGGTTSARYCYAVWLRHLRLMHDAGVDTRFRTVVELGPGDSIGTGLLALLTGAERYTALDVVRHADDGRNRRIFEELVPLLAARTPIPDRREFPGLLPELAAYDFPADVLTDERLAAALAPARVERIRAALAPDADDATVRYVCPWPERGDLADGSADLLFSHVAFQEIEDMAGTLRRLAAWVRPGGVMSHAVDLAAPFDPAYWNAHWRYSDLEWRVMRGRRPAYLNRLPYSAYVTLLREAGFELLRADRHVDRNALPRERLARRFRDLPPEDRETRAAYFLAVKR